MATDAAETGTGAAGRLPQPRRNLHDVLFTPHAACFAVASLSLSFLLPPDGLGATVCWFKACCGLPCPGCGLTRSITCISHLEFAKAWDYHPFGPLLYALFVANIVLLALPKALRRSLKRTMAGKNRFWYPVYMAVVMSFLTFGCLRILLCCSPAWRTWLGA